MSMIKDNSYNNEKKKITLLYGSKTEKDIIFKKDLDLINGSWLKKVYFLSTEKNSNYEYGRIDENMLLKHVKSLKDKKLYICEPQEMMKNMKQVLLKHGVKSEDIVIEDFFW